MENKLLKNKEEYPDEIDFDSITEGENDDILVLVSFERKPLENIPVEIFSEILLITDKPMTDSKENIKVVNSRGPEDLTFISMKLSDFLQEKEDETNGFEIVYIYESVSKAIQHRDVRVMHKFINVTINRLKASPTKHAYFVVSEFIEEKPYKILLSLF